MTDQRLIDIIRNTFGDIPEDDNVILNLIEYVESQRTEAYESGYNDGYTVGHAEGRLEGYKEGKKTGYDEGYNQAMNDAEERIRTHAHGLDWYERTTLSRIVKGNF